MNALLRRIAKLETRRHPKQAVTASVWFYARHGDARLDAFDGITLPSGPVITVGVAALPDLPKAAYTAPAMQSLGDLYALVD